MEALYQTYFHNDALQLNTKFQIIFLARMRREYQLHLVLHVSFECVIPSTEIVLALHSF